jgi:hypothetical protein
MISISKGDIVFEPLEFLIELLIRLFGKALSRTLPSEPIEQWGWSEWLWISFFLTAISLLVWAIVHRARSKNA